jgi:hypothetical protein
MVNKSWTLGWKTSDETAKQVKLVQADTQGFHLRYHLKPAAAGFGD